MVPSAHKRPSLRRDGLCSAESCQLLSKSFCPGVFQARTRVHQLLTWQTIRAASAAQTASTAAWVLPRSASLASQTRRPLLLDASATVGTISNTATCPKIQLPCRASLLCHLHLHRKPEAVVLVLLRLVLTAWLLLLHQLWTAMNVVGVVVLSRVWCQISWGVRPLRHVSLKAKNNRHESSSTITLALPVSSNTVAKALTLLFKDKLFHLASTISRLHKLSKAEDHWMLVSVHPDTCQVSSCSRHGRPLSHRNLQLLRLSRLSSMRSSGS